jgi:hypothetical protein
VRIALFTAKEQDSVSDEREESRIVSSGNILLLSAIWEEEYKFFGQVVDKGKVKLSLT